VPVRVEHPDIEGRIAPLAGASVSKPRLDPDQYGLSDAPEACFRFSETLDPSADAHYSDYIRVDPDIAPAIHATAADLCLGGLAYGTDYRVTLLKGLPSQSGDHTGTDETIEVSLGDRPPMVAVSGDGFILSRTTSNGIAIQTVNVDHVKVRVLRMSDRLLPSRIGRRGDWDGLPVLTGKQMTRYLKGRPTPQCSKARGARCD
jgi:uncharacterized protein YfaS (alpha-2-macroglobulin family)